MLTHSRNSNCNDEGTVASHLNVNGVKNSDTQGVSSLLPHTSQSTPWHVLCMQEPFKRCQGSPDTVASDSVRDDSPADRVSSSNGTCEPTAVALSHGHRPANPCAASEVDSLTTDDGHFVFCNRSDFSSAVAVHKDFVPQVRWARVTRFATYVLLGVILIVCAYLPQCGHGDDLYPVAPKVYFFRGGILTSIF